MKDPAQADLQFRSALAIDAAQRLADEARRLRAEAAAIRQQNDLPRATPSTSARSVRIAGSSPERRRLEESGI